MVIASANDASGKMNSRRKDKYLCFYHPSVEVADTMCYYISKSATAYLKAPPITVNSSTYNSIAPRSEPTLVHDNTVCTWSCCEPTPVCV